VKGRSVLRIIPPEQQYLIHLLASVLHDARPQNPPEYLAWEKLYRLSVRHGVANMVFYGLKRLNADQKPPQELMGKFHTEYRKAIAKEATQHIAVEQILSAFEENGIDCMPLKGYLIKYLYPQPDMRLMADVDILFKNEQTEQVKKLMLELGFTLEHQGGNHDVYYKKPFMNIEMHRRLVAENSPYSAYLSKTWDRATLKSGCRCIWQLSPEDFYIYLLIHLTKHYTGGGTGIRSFIDIWVYHCHDQDALDWDYVRTELEAINLREFAENIRAIGEVWFGSGQSNGLYEEMTEYIILSGAYGTKKHSIISATSIRADQKRLPSKYAYWLQLFFPPLKTLKISYPFLTAWPSLLPACWVLRGIKSLLFKRSHTFHMISAVHSVSGDDVARMESLHKKAGLLKQY
jgi:hypothetical protein